jgi:hypothetical protein
MKKVKYISILLILSILIPAILLTSCVEIDDSDADSSTLTERTIGEGLSGTIVEELGSNLNTSSTSSSASQYQNTRNSTSFEPTDITVLRSTTAASLTQSQMAGVLDAALKALSDANLSDSEDLIVIMPLLIEGAMGQLSEIGIDDETETTTIINIIINSIISSLNGRDQYLNDSSKEEGLTAKETLLNNISETAVGNLDEAGITSDITGCLGSIVETIVGSLDDGGLSSDELEGAIGFITAGAVGSLDNISGIDSDDLGELVSQVTSSATGALGNISMTDYDSDSLSGIVAKITAGATGALDDISMTGYDSDDLGDMVEKITAGATLGLDDISMDGYDSGDVSGMTTQITAGATAGLGAITMDGFDSDDISGLQTKIKSGVMDNLENLDIEGFTADSASSEISSAIDTVIQENDTDPRAIITFSFTAEGNSSLSVDVTATISGTSITATVPTGTTVTALVATFTTNGESVKVGGTFQVSGTTANNFSSSVTYTVNAVDGSTRDYTVTVSDSTASQTAASVVVFPDTDQTNCYSTTAQIDCSSTSYPRQDGWHSDGTSYTNNNDGTITDNYTGLMWQQSHNSSTVIQSVAKTYCDDQLTTGGYTDWRLPTVRELISILVFSTTVHSKDIFTDTVTSMYFTSEIEAGNSNPSSHVVDFYFGGGGVSSLQIANNSRRVRCVRGTVLAVDFSDNGDETITDRSTGLMWQQGAGGLKIWSNALLYCKNLNLAGHGDWRMPNIKELVTIADYSKTGTKIDSSIFTTGGNSFWSSTTYHFGLNNMSFGQIYAMFYSNGSFSERGKDSLGELDVRCVRDY